MQIIASSTIIANIKSTRFLGLIIDSTLSWKDHIVELTSKLNKACYAIRAIKPYMSLDRIIRIITNTGRCDSCRQLHKQLQILPLPSHYISHYLFLSTRIESISVQF